jgi:DNA-binding transcriptional regulator YiaG
VSDDCPIRAEKAADALLAARVAMMEALGLPYEALVKEAPDLVMQALLAAVTQPDAAERARLLTAYLGETQKLIDVASGIRNEAIRSLRTQQTASYEDIAELLGISKSRAQQLCKRLEMQDGAARGTAPA